jgi:hypothetical protein
MPETVTVAHGVADRVEPATAREREAQRLAYTAAVDAMARELRLTMARADAHSALLTNINERLGQDEGNIQRVAEMVDEQARTLSATRADMALFVGRSFMARLRWVFRGR